jgi:hypothetical protein
MTRSKREDWHVTEETRTLELHRVNFEVSRLKPFSSLAFPVFQKTETPPKQPSLGDELVTSFCRQSFHPARDTRPWGFFQWLKFSLGLIEKDFDRWLTKGVLSPLQSP